MVCFCLNCKSKLENKSNNSETSLFLDMIFILFHFNFRLISFLPVIKLIFLQTTDRNISPESSSSTTDSKKPTACLLDLPQIDLSFPRGSLLFEESQREFVYSGGKCSLCSSYELQANFFFHFHVTIINSVTEKIT